MTPGSRSRRGGGFTTRAGLTRLWETVRRSNLRHWPRLTPANEARQRLENSRRARWGNWGTVKMTNGLYSSPEEDWGSGHAPQFCCPESCFRCRFNETTDGLASD